MATEYREIPPNNLDRQSAFDIIEALTGNSNVKGVFYHEQTSVDLANITDGTGVTQSITVTGVELGDIVMGISFGVDLQDMTVTGYVQSSDTVEVRVQNESGSAVDLGSTTIRLIIYDVT